MRNFFSGDAFAVMRVQNFRLFLTYRFLMTMATLMQSVIVGWHLYSITKNVLSLGMIGITEVIPQVSIALFAGHFIDIWDRKKIINYTSLLLVLGALILLLFSMPTLRVYAVFGVAPMFVTIFLTGFTRGILMPAHTALMGQIVERELYTNAATWSSANWHVAAVLGPALGGLIYGFFGVVPAYATVLVLYVLAFLSITQIKKVKPLIIQNTGEGIFVRISEGVKYVFKSKELLGAFSLDMFAVLFGGAVALLPVFASEILFIGPQGLGLLRACPAIGAIFMSFYLMFNPPVNNTGRKLFMAVTGFGLCIIGFAISKNFYLSAVLLLLSGVFDNVSVVIRGTILQLYTPDEMRGRVASVNSIFIGSSNELGAFESGLAARFMGLVPSVIFGGTMTLLVVGITSKINPVLRRLSLKNKLD